MKFYKLEKKGKNSEIVEIAKRVIIDYKDVIEALKDR